MFTKKTISMFMVTVAAVGLLALQVNISWAGQQANKLEGVWVARVISLNGESGEYPFQWSYILSPDTSGQSASIHGSIDVAIPDLVGYEFDTASPFIGEIVKTGPDTTAFNSYWYGIKKVPFEEEDSGYGYFSFYYQLVFIGRNWGTSVFLGPDEAEVTDNIELYSPDDDEDGDGYPDPGSEPFWTSTTITRDTRMPSPVE